MKIAAYLHDIGKLAVPLEILNKSAKLSSDEWNILKTHTYYTYQALSTSKNLQTIKEWASYHHEKLNGNGYPFHLDENNLSLGSKIMSVADVFTAITEDRPYRKGMSYNKVIKILNEMSEAKELDENIVKIIINNFEEFNLSRKNAQQRSRKYYEKFNTKAQKIINGELYEAQI